jgi:hypothetical protein
MRMNELFVAITRPPETSEKEREANLLADRRVQYEELEKLRDSLR